MKIIFVLEVIILGPLKTFDPTHWGLPDYVMYERVSYGGWATVKDAELRIRIRMNGGDTHTMAVRYDAETAEMGGGACVSGYFGATLRLPWLGRCKNSVGLVYW